MEMVGGIELRHFGRTDIYTNRVEYALADGWLLPGQWNFIVCQLMSQQYSAFL
jgi:hypothetical protein